jgi:hypothetical protein
VDDQVRRALAVVGDRSESRRSQIGVTGGHVSVIYLRCWTGICPPKSGRDKCALGWGGLAAANVPAGLVVSAGTGTAMVAARGEGCDRM